MEHDYLVSSETEAAATKGVKSIPSLADLHKRTKEIIERARKDEEERLETGVIQSAESTDMRHDFARSILVGYNG